jgi:CheY-like chemotaxis protein
VRSNEQLSFLSAAIRGERAGSAATFVGELPRLSGGTLTDADLGVRSTGGLLVCTARFDGAIAADVRARLAFWAWTVGATVAGREGDASGASFAAAALARCDRVLRAIPPSMLPVAALALVAGIPQASAPSGAPLAVRVDLAGPASGGVAFDRRAATLFFPTPHLLPVGDALRLRVVAPGGAMLDGCGTVIQARSAGSEGPRSPAGLLVALTERRGEVLDLVQAHADVRRAAPRYALQAPARLEVRGAPADTGAGAGPPPAAEAGASQVENLSQGGAYVRTGLRLGAGTKVALGVELPGGRTLSVPAVVVRRDDRGVGVRFETDRAGEAAVARALEEVTARTRRALVVDDDTLARRMLGDALAERGFEVFASCDGHDGLEAIIDRLLELDVLVTDLRMPGIDGEQLLRTIRGAGGEQDLAIVVVSADVDATLERRLLAAGADAVLAKGDGGDAVGAAAERAVLHRRCGGALRAPAPAA